MNPAPLLGPETALDHFFFLHDLDISTGLAQRTKMTTSWGNLCTLCGVINMTFKELKIPFPSCLEIRHSNHTKMHILKREITFKLHKTTKFRKTLS